MNYDPELAERAVYSSFFGYMGVAAAQVFTVFGAAYGTAKSAVGICSMGVMRPELIMKSVIPVVMAGIIGIYGLVVAMVLRGAVCLLFARAFCFFVFVVAKTLCLCLQVESKDYTLKQGFSHLAAGLTCGLCGLGAGYAIGVVGDAGVRGTAQQPRLFVGMILILIFSEVRCPNYLLDIFCNERRVLGFGSVRHDRRAHPQRRRQWRRRRRRRRWWRRWRRRWRWRRLILST